MPPARRRARPTAEIVDLPDPQRVSVSKRGVVTTAHWCASEAGARMMRSGGNAIDAAVAAAFALTVCEPAASGIGGQTKMLVHLADRRRTFALDGSSRAPHRTVPQTLTRAQQLRGWCATTVPSTPAALAYALEVYGTKKLAEVLAPAIELAQEGYPITPLQNRLTRRELEHLRAGSAGVVFLDHSREPRPVGSLFRQPVLARTLERLAQAGWQDFYLGEIAARIAAEMEARDGLIRLDDLAQIPMPIERRPVSGRFEGYRVFTFPPPGAGRLLLTILNFLSQFPSALRTVDTPQGALVLCEAIRQANQDRRDHPFEPNVYPQLDDKTLLSEEYARKFARRIRKRLRSSGETTHLSVMDGAGNVVALTQSIERVYGSFEVSELGFLYNNYMSAFVRNDIAHPHYLRPGAVPWASVAPTIVMRRSRPLVAMGSPGSERIASTIAQVLARLEHQSLLDAITAPRLHAGVTGEVRLEATRIRDDVPPFLEKHGFTTEALEPFSFALGCVQAVQRDGERIIGAADPRRDGAAVGV